MKNIRFSLVFLFLFSILAANAQMNRRDSVMEYAKTRFKNATTQNPILRADYYEIFRRIVDYSALIEKNDKDSSLALRNDFNALSNNVVRLLDVGTYYVAPSGVLSLAVMGDEFKPYPTPWDARNAAATAIKNGVISAATIVVKKGVYTTGLTGSGASYTRDFLNNNSFNTDTLPYYTSSPNSVSLIVNKVNYEFRDGVELGAKAGNYSCFITTNKPDTCSIVGIGTGSWFKEITYNQNTSAQTNYVNISNDSSQISVITPNSDYINSFGWQGWNVKKYVNFAFNRVLVNRSKGLLLSSQRFTATTNPVFLKLKVNFWSDTAAKYVANWPTNTAPNDCSLLQTVKLSGAEVNIEIEKAEFSSPTLNIRGGSGSVNARACDSNNIMIKIDNLYQYRQFNSSLSPVVQIFDSIVKSNITLLLKTAVVEGGFIQTGLFNGLQIKDTKIRFDCLDCRYQPSKYASDNTRPAFNLVGNATDTLSTIHITGNYVVDSAQVIVINGSAPLNIVISGTFISRGGKPIIENNNVNARIIVLAGSKFVTNGVTCITGTSGAKIYMQQGTDFNGAVSNVTLLGSKPSNWYF